MARLGKEFIGKLPPGAQEQCDAALKSYAENDIKHIRVLAAPDGCKAALALKDKVFPVSKPPALPLPGCDRDPCCGCCFLPVFADEV